VRYQPGVRLLDICLPGSLQRLELGTNSLFDAGRQFGSFPCLREISMTGAIDVSGALCLAQKYPHFCEQLQLDLNLHDHDALYGFCHMVRPLLPITKFSCFNEAQRYPQFTDAKLHGLVEFNSHSLRELRLCNSGVTDAGVRALLTCNGLACLHLDYQRRLSLASARVIGQLLSLQELSVQCSPELSADAALKEYAQLVNLTNLSLGRTACSRAGLWQLPRDLQKLELVPRLVGLSCYEIVARFRKLDVIYQAGYIMYQKGDVNFRIL
jgi:hypothetical protein